MPIFHSFARWMAVRLHREGKAQQSIRWYERWGVKRMSWDERVDYAGYLHENGNTGRAVDVLTELLRQHRYPNAYERRAHIYNELGQEEAAIADLNAAIELDPEPYLFWYTRAISHNNRGELEEAARDFKEALKRREDAKSSTYYELGNVYMKMERFEEAESCYQNAAADPSKAIPHYYYRQAQALEQLERMEEALIVLEKAIRLHEEWRILKDRGAGKIKERTRYSLAAIATFIQGAEEEYGFQFHESKLCETMGNLSKALEAIDRALLTYPNAADLELRKGYLLRQMNRYEEAAEMLNRIIATNPSWLPPYMELVAVYRAQGKSEETVHVLLEAKSRYPDHPVVRFWLADAYREADQPDKARQESEELTRLEPDDPLNWKQRAEILIDAERYREADEAYTRALQLEETADFYMRRSFSRFMEDRYEEAMMDIQAAVNLDESLLKDGKTAYALGELYMGMQNWQLADAEYSRALALEPDNPQIYDRRSRCRMAAERLTDALEDCNRGLQLTGMNPRLIWLRGLIHYRLEELEGALLDLTTYTEIVPDDSQGYYNLGLVYKQLDRCDDAVTAFTKVLEINPFDAQAYLERASLWYHHFFDRIRATDDLAQWLLYAEGASGQGDRFELLNDVRGFDDEMRERAKEQFLRVYGSSRYLS
ncbi:tetratricopeptide repeat protein [Cohnella terricola]|uniref:Tetratricopeptide repeat protein n=1 Tax=Cohnella terricola TaxID=1289167 RepID=A0A559JQU6_9BACL|nr:tetratricopeptide repeat protein [Cohnella terricola]TVY02254.1 tetratricopeptide repeat protein [Cohnella terricola]